MSVSLAESYRLCRRKSAQSGSSFYMAMLALPRIQRRAMYALYAFARHTDDLGDSDAPADQRARQLQQWREALQQAFESKYHDPLLPALIDTVRTFRIPTEYLTELVTGVNADVEPPCYQTAEQLNQYCYRVASVVGLACAHIWGFHSELFREPAIQCGWAFQWTNILRDLPEDARRGRVYLPRQDLARFGVSAESLASDSVSTDRSRLVLFEAQRVQRWYESSRKTSDYLSANGQLVFAAMHETYYELLREIIRRDGDVFGKRVRLSWQQKLAIAARYGLRGRLLTGAAQQESRP